MRVLQLPVREIRSCGLCWYGDCMCPKPTDYGPPRPTSNQRIVPAGQHLLTFGKDYTDPAVQSKIDAETAEFCAEMRSKIR